MRVVVGDNTYGCVILMGAYVTYQDEFGKDFSEEKMNDTTFTRFMYCCVKSTCRRDNVKFDATFEQFADAITTDSYNEFVKEILYPYVKKNLTLRMQMIDMMNQQ